MSRKRPKRRQGRSTNPIVRQLRQLRSRRARDETGAFYIEGNRIVAQALQSPYQIELGVIAPALLAGEHAGQTAQALRETGAPVTELSPAEFGAISFKENLQGIGAVVRARLEGLEAVQPGQGLGWVALDNVGNSGNLGAILRTCDAVGCQGIILLGHTTDPYHPAEEHHHSFDVAAMLLIDGVGAIEHNFHFEVLAGQPLAFANIVVGPPQSPSFHVSFDLLYDPEQALLDAPLYRITTTATFLDVPEPASAAMLTLLGGAALGAARRRHVQNTPVSKEAR